MCASASRRGSRLEILPGVVVEAREIVLPHIGSEKEMARLKSQIDRQINAEVARQLEEGATHD